MSKYYPFAEIEPRWQQLLGREQDLPRRRGPVDAQVLLPRHVPVPLGRRACTSGHLEGYTATDIVCRYKRMRGFNVLHLTGWDAFGLPAEQYAVKTGVHPAITTRQNIDNFRRQMQRAGLSLRLGPRGRHHRSRVLPLDAVDLPEALRARAWRIVAEVPVNWCPALGTVLANEEVVDGKREVGGFAVIRKPMRQWVLQASPRTPTGCSRTSKLVDWPASTLRDAEELDRPLDRRRGGLRARRRERQAPRLHHAPRHAVRRHLHGARARASAGRRGHDARRSRPRSRPTATRRRARATSRARRTRRRPACSPAATRSTRSTARSSRSGSRTTC